MMRTLLCCVIVALLAVFGTLAEATDVVRVDQTPIAITVDNGKTISPPGDLVVATKYNYVVHEQMYGAEIVMTEFASTSPPDIASNEFMILTDRTLFINSPNEPSAGAPAVPKPMLVVDQLRKVMEPLIRLRV